MRLPNANRAYVEENKVIRYLLAFDHPKGSSKAAFFVGHGFEATHWTVLADALCKLARDYPVTRVIQNDFVTKYVVEGLLATSQGDLLSLRTVWAVAEPRQAPRFVTAYPLH